MAKARWQSSAKWTLVAVIAVVVLGGAAFWWFVLRGDAPERASLPVRGGDTTATSAGAGTAPAGAGTLDGTYRVSPGADVFVAGSAVFGANDYAQAIGALRGALRSRAGHVAEERAALAR